MWQFFLGIVKTSRHIIQPLWTVHQFVIILVEMQLLDMDGIFFVKLSDK